MKNIIYLNEINMNLATQNGQMADASPMRVTLDDLDKLEQRAIEQRKWLRELKADIEDVSAKLGDNRFSYYDLMFMKRSFKTCWTLYRAIMSDKAELQAAFKQQDVKKAA